MMGGMVNFMVANRNNRSGRNLIYRSGFPVQKQQVRMLGHECHSFDIYDFRGRKLRDKIESYFKTGKISSVLYSNPIIRPICLTEEELAIIGEMASRKDVIVIEDLAYFGMDFRKDYLRRVCRLISRQ